MRSLVAGIVGGVSGGGAMLMALVLLHIEGTETGDRASAIVIQRSRLPPHTAVPESPTAGVRESSRLPSESTAVTDVQGQDASPTTEHYAIATAPIMITSAVVPDVRANPAEWVLPAGAVKELGPEPAGRSPVANQPASPISLVTKPNTVAADTEREASDGDRQDAPSIVEAELEVTAKTVALSDIMRPAETAQERHDPKTSTSTATAVLPDPPASRAAAAPAQREPAELKALRSFRLSVPKELPKVEFASPAALTWTASTPSDIDEEMQSRSTVSRAPSIPAQPTSVPASSPSGRNASAPSAPAAAASPSATTAAAVTEAQSAKESLLRASDAVKRLSRRMGGRHGR
jgi:hypothetical protein